MPTLPYLTRPRLLARFALAAALVAGCGGTPSDDAGADAPTVDSSVDAAPADARMDARPDVAMDAAAPDVAMDAPVPDAPAVDMGPDTCGMLCSGRCTDTQADPTHCGDCFTSCATGQMCIDGSCQCAVGSLLCPGGCTDPMSDDLNCTLCGRACPAGLHCHAGACGPVPLNDTRAMATPLNLAMPAQTLSVVTIDAHNDTRAGCGCGGPGPDVFYSFTLTQPELVYADTVGSSYDAIVFVQDATGHSVPIAGSSPVAYVCDDNGTLFSCSAGNQGVMAAVLQPGSYFLVVGSCDSGGAATVHFQHLPLGSGAVTRLSPTATTAQNFPGVTSGVGRVSGTCCSSGPEDTYWFATCPDFTSRAFSATTCGSAAFNTSLEERSAGRAPVATCNDDGCGIRSLLTTTVADGAGLHALYVDGCNESGAYTLTTLFGSCATGLSECNGRCVNTVTSDTDCGSCGHACAATERCSASACACVATCSGRCVDTRDDAANCGSCAHACTAGQSCVASRCTVGNDDCTGATALTLLPGTTTVTGTTVGATNTAGSCGTGADVYYSFTLTAREYVYADTFGSALNTSLGLVAGGCGALATECSDDACSTTQSQLAQVLDPGTYYLVVDAPTAVTGAFTLHVQHVPVSGYPTATPPAGAYSLSGTTVGASNSLGSCGAGLDVSYAWLSCPGYLGGTFTAQTCGTGATFDTWVGLRNGDEAAAQCDDNGCGSGSRLSRLIGTVTPGAGLHVVSVDGVAGASGAFTVTGVRP